MKIVQLLEEHAVFLFALFAIGCGVSFVREFSRNLSPHKSRLLRLLEWCLLPPGFAAIFVALQQGSVRHFALNPKWTVAAYLSVAALSVYLIIEKKRMRRAVLSWIGGLVGIPGLVFSLILLGLFFQSPKKFESVRETYIKLAATEGKIAPDFTFTLISNRNDRTLSDYRQRVVLLNFWATWCVPCLKEMPDLDMLQKRFESAGLVVINVSDESLEVIDRYLVKNPMATTHGRVEKRDVPEFYQFGGARPTSFLISTDGRIIDSIVGAKDIGYFEGVVRKARTR